MKKILFTIALMATGLPGFSQDTTGNASGLLPHYYNLKNALVAGDAASAAANAEQLLQTLNTIDYKVISEGSINALLKDATALSSTKDLKKQRTLFANLSRNLSAVAASVRLTARPVYKLYCPMKGAYWLSAEKAVQNPYYGSSMLTCGQVVATLQP
ncbi:DUF3347 domain-containing protein [Paraflavisolibacter sp. H34]|uniref:DUF3347 domain-containing protein n=1 Tax=Huijunlia imazamoxiresistens TaxID=3127457 RepID=UPI00301963A5